MSTRGSSAFGSRGRGRGAQSATGGTREPLTTSNIPPSRGRGRGGGRAGASAATSITPRGGAQSRNTSTSYTTPRAAFNTNNASATATATASSDRVEIDLLSDEDDNNHGNSRRDKQRGGASTDEDMEVDGEEGEEEEEEEDDTRKTIPPELLTRLLHEFFEKDETRITRDANDAVAKYVDVFVREAIARAAVERGSGTGGFLEVEDLEKIAPQLLLDL